MDENPCMMKLSLQHFFSFDEHEEEGRKCVPSLETFFQFLAWRRKRRRRGRRSRYGFRKQT
jgi:hypothetical protein